MKRENETRAKVQAIMARLESTPLDVISQEEAFQKDGNMILIQEVFFSQNNYEKLPDDEMIQRCAELGNGTPLLLKMESMGLDGADAIKAWTYWARKGNAYALLRLGLCRLHGYGIEKDAVRSRQLLLQAVQCNYIPAAYILSQIAIGRYKPDFGHPTPEDKKYEFYMTAGTSRSERYKKYLKFGHK